MSTHIEKYKRLPEHKTEQNSIVWSSRRYKRKEVKHWQKSKKAARNNPPSFFVIVLTELSPGLSRRFRIYSVRPSHARPAINAISLLTAALRGFAASSKHTLTLKPLRTILGGCRSGCLGSRLFGSCLFGSCLLSSRCLGLPSSRRRCRLFGLARITGRQKR